MITSTNNQQIKNIQFLIDKPRYRKETGLFVAEGAKMFAEAPSEMISRVYASESFMNSSPLALKVRSLPHEIVTDQVYHKMSDTKTPQGILTVLTIPSYDEEKIFREGGCFLILNKIQDPGNLGTMIRTGEGAGISAVIMDEGCVDVYNPKVIRSTMGSIYRVPIIRTGSLEATIDNMKAAGIKMMAAHLKGDVYYDSQSYDSGVGIMIGNEGNGLDDSISGLADVMVRIPMDGQLESLNAAVSAAILMYEVRRHRAR